MMFWTLLKLINICRHAFQHEIRILKWKNPKRPSYFDKIMPDSKLFLKKSLFLCIESTPVSRNDGGTFCYTKTSEADFHLPGNTFCALYPPKEMFSSRICYLNGVLKNWQNLSFYDGFWKMLDFAIKIEFHGATLISLFSSILKIWI